MRVARIAVESRVARHVGRRRRGGIAAEDRLDDGLRNWLRSRLRADVPVFLTRGEKPRASAGRLNRTLGKLPVIRRGTGGRTVLDARLGLGRSGPRVVLSDLHGLLGCGSDADAARIKLRRAPGVLDGGLKFGSRPTLRLQATIALIVLSLQHIVVLAVALADGGGPRVLGELTLGLARGPNGRLTRDIGRSHVWRGNWTGTRGRKLGGRANVGGKCTVAQAAVVVGRSPHVLG